MKYILILAVLFTVQAYASSKPEPPDEPTTQTQTQGMEQLQTQSQTQLLDVSGGDGGRGGEATGGNVGDIKVDARTNYKRPYRNTPNFYAPAVAPTVPCFKGFSIGAGLLGGAATFARGKVDENCERRELIRLAPESHKLYLFCNEPTILAMFEDFQTCLDYVPKGGDEPNDDGGASQNRYDDTALTQQIEALVARVGAVEGEAKQTKVRARERAKTAPPDPYKAMHNRVLAQTEYIK